MVDNFGTGVSRVLDPRSRALTQVILQKGKPPLDSEINLLQQISSGARQQILLRGTPSGFLGNEVNTSEDLATDPSWSNWFKLGSQRAGEANPLWAVVNGWLVPVMGTKTGTPPGSPNDVDSWNRVTLDPPPSNSGDFRSDFVFLEVWQARIPAEPSTLNKPTASSIYRYGNLEGGASYLTDDSRDPNVGFETTERVQTQYRIRVVKGMSGLTSSPDGFDQTSVKAKGAFDPTGQDTVTTFTYSNMRGTLGDPGLWRAGDGNPANTLGTVDGYVYAIPICVVFRRNGVVWSGDSTSANLHGGFNRNPTASSRAGSTTFTTVPTLASLVTASQTTLSLTSATAIPLPATPSTPVYVQVGDEVLTYTSISGTTLVGLTRGVLGTVPETHPAGAVVKVLANRPDGLFADQVADTDILDLRHRVNPNGFDYDTLLKSNLDKLLQGKLRASWKRSSGGPQGTFIFYQDKISAVPASLGVTKVDAPDGHREVFSDAAVQEKVEVVVGPYPNIVSSGSQSVSKAWSLSVNATTTRQKTANQWSSETTLGAGDGDRIVIPVSQFKNSLPGSDADQVRFLVDGLPGAVQIRIDGEETPISSSYYTVTPVSPGPTDDLVIEFIGTTGPLPTARNLYITANVLYGPGRGISRRPDSVHSIALTNPSVDLLVQPAQSPSNNYPLRAVWAPLWSKYRNTVYKNMLPSTAEAYADPGSKTVILTPFRRVQFPDKVYALDGDNLNLPLGAPQGLMPANKLDGSAKWGATDPLGLFTGHSDPIASEANLYVTLPRHLVPGWGAVYAPILPVNDSDNVFHRGLNFLLMAKEGLNTSLSSSEHSRNYINYAATAPLSYASFSTGNFSGPTTVQATYNATFAYSGVTHCGIQFYTDTRGLGRKGLQLPPFYGIARLFAVYESADYKVNGSAFNSSTRTPLGAGATNLLRQNFSGPTFWIELDDDGDSTFILNAEALDLSKSPNAIATFESKHYVVESSIFGFDRGSFDNTKPFRLLLSRNRPTGEATGITKNDNITDPIDSPMGILPGPLTGSDTALVSYSRTPYQGDAWGSQTSYQDISYNPGPIQSSVANQVTATTLNPLSLTRPNQKPLEVLTSVGFITTLGTGRVSGDLASNTSLDYRNVGYEDPTVYPPATSVSDRPKVLPGALGVTEGDAHTSYLGCTERLPLGALRRDKDFRGGRFTVGGGGKSAFIYVREDGVGSFLSSLAKTQDLVQDELNLNPASVASGQPGEILVQVDGEPGNYSNLYNFRTYRGGSAFCGSGSYPGGEVYSSLGEVKGPSADKTNILVGKAYLVRNAPTNVGASEVSAGDELMMLITTTAYHIEDSGTDEAFVGIGTNGTGEGISASDLYRIEGHPLTSNHIRFELNPNTIQLSNRTELGIY